MMSKSSESKIKSFNIGPIGKRPLSKKDQEKLKKEEEEKAAAEVFEDFVASFEEPACHGKLFVRGSVINPGAGEEKSTSNTGKIYKPPKLAELPLKKEDSKQSSSSEKNSKKREKEKKKSNLELFKEELKVMQHEREERHRIKNLMKEEAPKSNRFETVEPLTSIKLADDYRMPVGSFDMGDPTTTNLYLGNINPKMTEQQLCELFGQYGPLASVKIMWPRSEEEKSRGRNCGFVAFMNRQDGERALQALKGKDIMDCQMKLGWGKAVPIPPHPIYIPPHLLELTMPPPPSGLPFNAQPDKNDLDMLPIEDLYPPDPERREMIQRILSDAVVKVVIPTERNLLCLIHRMIEFVVREGPMFEAMIMNREINNPMFRFLFENQSPAHVYYRWKLYSILQGDLPNRWRIEEFRMFINGSLWKPPPLNPYHQGMPDDAMDFKKDLDEPTPAPPPPVSSKKGQLSNSQRDRFESMLRSLTTERSKIADLMVYCIEHAEAAEEIVECIAESLSILQTPLSKKIARLYLISDILHNCCVKVANVHFYRKGFQEKLIEVFKDVHDAYIAIEGRLKAEQFKQKIMQCFRAWEDWAIYPSDYLIQLQNIFLGLITKAKPTIPSPEHHEEPENDDIDGMPLASVDEEAMPDDLDGAPLASDIDGEPLPDEIKTVEADIDGIPLCDDIDGEPLSTEPSKPMKYAPSKWETVDPDMVQAQAMTTSKWDTLEHEDELDQDQDDDEFDGRGDEKETEEGERDNRIWIESLKTDKSMEKRAKLREIELKVMKYQDELESGKRTRKLGMTLGKQIEHYRQKLIKKVREKERDKERDIEKREERKKERKRSSSPNNSPQYKRVREILSPVPNWSGPRSRSRSPPIRIRREPTGTTPKRSSHRSRSPPSRRSRRSRSRSPPYRVERRRSRSPSPSRKSRKKKSKY